MNEHKKGTSAIDVAQKMKAREDGRIIDLPFGIKGKLVPVSASLIEAVTSKVKDPDVPIRHNEDKGRDEEYPLDPEYQRAKTEAARLRGVAGMDAMVLFGLELTDGVPSDDKWIKQLRFMEMRGQIDLSEFDLDDPMHLEFVYKRYVAVSAEVLNKISEISGVSPAEVAEAEGTFPGNEAR